MSRCDLTFAPRLLASPRAAAYLGISETTLRGLGLPRRVLGAKRLYDRLTLDEYADSLPETGEQRDSLENDRAECDRLFGAL